MQLWRRPWGIWRRPWGAFGHAGLDSDLPGPHKPPETSNTLENRTQKKSTVFFSGPLFAYRDPLERPYVGPDEILVF